MRVVAGEEHTAPGRFLDFQYYESFIAVQHINIGILDMHGMAVNIEDATLSIEKYSDPPVLFGLRCKP